MSFMTLVALIGSFIALAVGFASILGETGYGFDLRRKSSRRKDGARAGGRRSDDRAAA